jgi:hypothetical protein
MSAYTQKNEPRVSLSHNLKKAALPFIVLLALFLLVNLSGCSSNTSTQWDLLNPPVVISEVSVVREPPVVHVRPSSDAPSLKVLFMPFRVTQPMSDPEMAGYGVSKLFWQTWASMNIFQYMEFMPGHGPFRPDMALRLAKARGADMVVGGYVMNILVGGTVARSNLAIQFEAYDVSSGLLVWSMTQAASIEKPSSDDYVVFKTRNKTPSDPIYALTATIAGDMGQVMLNWTQREEMEAARAEEQRKEEEKGFLDQARDFFSWDK